MDRQQKAIIQVECQQFLNRVTSLIDAGQWEELALCYTEDGILFRPSDSENGIEGRAAILESFITRPPRITCHMLANTYCEIIGSDNVIATSRVWLVASAIEGKRPLKADSNMMIGSFVDTLVRVNEQWLIQCRKGGIELKYTYE